MLNKNLL